MLRGSAASPHKNPPTVAFAVRQEKGPQGPGLPSSQKQTIGAFLPKLGFTPALFRWYQGSLSTHQFDPLQHPKFPSAPEDSSEVLMVQLVSEGAGTGGDPVLGGWSAHPPTHPFLRGPHLAVLIANTLLAVLSFRTPHPHSFFIWGPHPADLSSGITPSSVLRDLGNPMWD